MEFCFIYLNSSFDQFLCVCVSVCVCVWACACVSVLYLLCLQFDTSVLFLSYISPIFIHFSEVYLWYICMLCHFILLCDFWTLVHLHVVPFYTFAWFLHFGTFACCTYLYFGLMFAFCLHLCDVLLILFFALGTLHVTHTHTHTLTHTKLINSVTT